MKNVPHYYQQRREEVTCGLPVTYRRVLEIGCGEGFFRENLKADCEYWGVEYSSTAAESAKNRLSNVLIGTYAECQDNIPDKYFDLIICNDVIEHMPDHMEFLHQIKSKIAPGGVIMGSIPNIRHYSILYELIVKKEWQYRPNGILDETHLRFFTKKSLIRTLIEADYTIDFLAGINFNKPNTTPTPKYAKRIIRLLAGKESRYIQFCFRAHPNENE